MFKDVYKKANDDIKGDRAILDRAFLQAAQPVKKTNPVIKYSFIGTAVAAVLVLGAVFANPSVFTNRSNDLGKYTAVTPTENVEIETNVTTAVIPEVVSVDASMENDVPVNAQVTDKKAVTPRVETVEPKQETVPEVVEDVQSEEAIVIEDDVVEDDYGIAVMSIEDESDEVYEYATGETVGFTLRNPNLIEETTETAPDETAEDDEWIEESGGGSSNGVFSYMYDVSVYEAGEPGVKTEGFVNTDISPVTNSAEAVERAKAECTVEYNATAVYHDSIENVWKVHFYIDDIWTEGGDQCVYMNSDGVTTLIVYGE